MHASRVNVASIHTFSTVITRPAQLPIVCDSTQLSSVLQTAWNEAVLCAWCAGCGRRVGGRCARGATPACPVSRHAVRYAVRRLSARPQPSMAIAVSAKPSITIPAEPSPPVSGRMTPGVFSMEPRFTVN